MIPSMHCTTKSVCHLFPIWLHTYLSRDLLVDDCMDLALKVFMNASHKNERWGSALLRHPYSLPFIFRSLLKSHRKRRDIIMSQAPSMSSLQDAGDIDGSQSLDRLYLLLGLLTHLVQVADEAKRMTRDTSKPFRINFGSSI